MCAKNSENSPLKGINVVQIGGGAAGSWCARMLADLGAEVAYHDPADRMSAREEIPGDKRTRGLVAAWLADGKRAIVDEVDVDKATAAADLVVLCEDVAGYVVETAPKCATIDLSWFGSHGPCADWVGNDLIVQALSGMIFPAGPIDGPPRQLGDMHSALIGGASGFVAGLAALLAAGSHRYMEVSILEACMVLGELQTSDAQYLGRPVPRSGLNRFSPTCPISIHKCREGWLGITIITPAQWVAFCEMLGLPDLATNSDLSTIYLREAHADELERIFDDAFRSKTAAEWAAIARQKKVPLVEVPDAGALLDHPIFRERGALRPIRVGDGSLIAPASPLHVAAPEGSKPRNALGAGAPDPTALLAGLRIADFSMGWAGPLATRIFADLGAEVIKIEAGRYPDWWRATQWTEEAIAENQFEKSCRFSAMNRGKRSVSFDLTTEEGRSLARDLVAVSDAVIENHAAGVMSKLGMSWNILSQDREDLVMASMSAYGTGNEWSDTRAYGSTLEQGSGMPSFRGTEGEPPVMGHIAYGDPVGGIYGAGALLAALYHRQKTGCGQWLNLSHIEALLPFTAPAVLTRGATGIEPQRIGNRHVDMVPHGIFPSQGAESWLAVSVNTAKAWQALSRLIGRPDWADGRLDRIDDRRSIETEIETALADWLRSKSASDAADALQAIGVAAAPVLTPEAALDLPHFAVRNFIHVTERAYIGVQRQTALAIEMDHQRPPLRGVAPMLGADSESVVTQLLGMEPSHYADLLSKGVISLRPTSLRQAQ